MDSSDPYLRVILAGFAGAIGLTVAAVSTNTAVRIIAIVAAFLVVAALVWSLRKTHPREARITVAVVAALSLAVGIGVAVVVGASDNPVAPRVGDPGFVPNAAKTADDRIAANPNARLAAALERADRLVPRGSATVLRVGIDGDRISLDVFDPRNGDSVSTSFSESSGWSREYRRRATDRNTFSRAEVARMDLDKARPQVLAMTTALKADLTHQHASDGITVKRRYQDHKLVGEFSLSGNEIEVDDQGHVADTADAAWLATVVPLAQRVMVANGLDPDAPIVNRFDFRAYDDAASSISASSVQNSGGFVIRFASGPVDEIVVVPGNFPLVRRTDRSYTQPGFALTALRTETLLKVRDDIMARAKSPAYDTELVGLEVGRVPGADRTTPAIRMQVGPSSDRPGGIYTMDGVFMRTGRY
ncbi:hypothetical protein [Gordonia crocea]|uniref:Uncharacterized protein n=1 Tax=Gordonia crocea TaxID=589162 RepID=A0A7I9UV66_9ACTN|nr:hypothetical protein [Gordonia crocea]GED97117.1 hypothetical protein nbrc107697_11560 [Gordonia crocea]